MIECKRPLLKAKAKMERQKTNNRLMFEGICPNWKQKSIVGNQSESEEITDE
jgi:hypothetical protein